MIYPDVTGQQFQGMSRATSLMLFSLLHWVTGSHWMLSAELWRAHLIHLLTIIKRNAVAPNSTVIQKE